MDLHKPVDYQNRTYDELTWEEKLRVDHQKLHEEHQGHEDMHVAMFMIWIVIMVVVQFTLLFWKKQHYRSYSIVSLIAIWTIPCIISIHYGFWRFILCWLIFTVATLMIGREATRKPIKRSVPRLVYKWFYLIYIASYVLGIIGYGLVMGVFFGLNFIFGHSPDSWSECAVIFVYYGLYFGILGRDISEICTDKMTTYIGYYSPKGMPSRTLEPNICAICGNQLLTMSNENTYKLSCEHTFHEFCIRGWFIIGKKQICPYCKEKVNINTVFSQPWEKPHVLYGQLLDFARWLVGWQPLIIAIVKVVHWSFGLK